MDVAFYLKRDGWRKALEQGYTATMILKAVHSFCEHNRHERPHKAGLRSGRRQHGFHNIPFKNPPPILILQARVLPNRFRNDNLSASQRVIVNANLPISLMAQVSADPLPAIHLLSTEKNITHGKHLTFQTVQPQTDREHLF